MSRCKHLLYNSNQNSIPTCHLAHPLHIPSKKTLQTAVAAVMDIFFPEMATTDFRGKAYLVIGGTQFMGRLCVEYLLDAGAEIAVLNRGVTPSPFSGNPRVHHIICDRFNERKKFRRIIGAGPQFSETLRSKRKLESGDTKEETSIWDGVIDFVCFQNKNIMDVINHLKTKHYIFISTDSVYMACDLEATAESSKRSDGRLLENDTFEPTDISALKSRNEYQYDYGNGKLQCERALLSSDTFKHFTILRFPDV